MIRHPIRTSATESAKWSNGHNAGCCLYAPDDECICTEFKVTSPVGDKACADCGGRPEIIMLAQNTAKCVSCFLRAAMNAPCFKCKRKPTEAIVRAITVEGKEDTVGVCMECLKAQEQIQNN